MFNHPVVSAIVGVGINLFFLLMVAAFSWHQWFLGPFNQQRHNNVVKIGFDDDDTTVRPTTVSLDTRRAELREKLDKQSKAFSSSAGN
jgi:hypothetical protein